MFFGWSVAPRMLRGGHERSLILAEILLKAGQKTCFSVFFPFHPGSCIPLPNDANNFQCYRSAGGDFRRSAASSFEIALSISWLFQQGPGYLYWGHARRGMEGRLLSSAFPS